jgi:hypothetical protein
MKKFIVIALMLLGFVSNVSAAPPALPPTQWIISHVLSTAGDKPNQWDGVQFSTSTHWNHDGLIYAVVQVNGYSSPIVTYNNGAMQLVDTRGIDTNGDGYYNGWMYLYVSSGPSGNIEVKDWYNNSFATRDTVFVQ